ncbi:MAG: TPM domain-containing protein [Pseudomonadota bacterium]|nr:TPM domain-containing protein [Pseudomonadota bacterium]MDP1902851.1 TPM domain-containing protein [Pseudomonadota bacterium]MDP2352835.1 TPM domain-containing protein [Pseudomonadota bacterium]
MNRLLRHLIYPDWLIRRRFPEPVLERIETAVGTSERGHAGELRFAVEGTLHPGALWVGMTARERALDVFSSLRIWDTAANNGVLIYLLLAERDVEIVADRGFNGLVAPAEWEDICREMEACLRRGEYEVGVLRGIERVDALLRRHFPGSGDNPNELPDAPRVL